MLIAAASSAADAAPKEDAWKVIVPLIAAVMAFIGVMFKLWWDARCARRERLRELYAGGWAAIQAYKEMAFAIRRRNIEDRANERVRLSEAMRQIQRDIAYHEALIGRERSGRVAVEYRALVSKTREVAGSIIRRSWDEEPIEADREMHAPHIARELSEMVPFENDYMNAVADEVGGWRRS
jgi:hypothetical protein